MSVALSSGKIHYSREGQAICGAGRQLTSDRVEVSCRNCADRLRSEVRADYYDYERAEQELSSTGTWIGQRLLTLRDKFPYIQSEVWRSSGHIALCIRFWIPEARSSARTSLNISHTATPNFIQCRAVNDGELVLLSEFVASLADECSVRVRRKQTRPALEFEVKPFFYQRGTDKRIGGTHAREAR